MSNYPPGVTGNEPQITGEWPCDHCDGAGGWVDDGTCPLCKGTGIYPEDAWPIVEIAKEIREVFKKNGWGDVEFDTDDEFLALHTNFRIYGDNVRVEE